jgi:hypothetical protein
MPPDTETTYPKTTGFSKLHNALTADCTALTNINNNNQPKKKKKQQQKTEGKTPDLRSTTTCDEAEIKRTEMSCCKWDFSRESSDEGRTSTEEKNPREHKRSLRGDLVDEHYCRGHLRSQIRS